MSSAAPAQMRIPVVAIDGARLSPTTPKRARTLIENGVAEKRFDVEGRFYLQMRQAVGTVVPHA